MKQLEAAVLAELREVTGHRKLRQKDIMEWSTGDVKPGDGETLVFLPALKVHVAYKAPDK